jgi:hypothetical protein
MERMGSRARFCLPLVLLILVAPAALDARRSSTFPPDDPAATGGVQLDRRRPVPSKEQVLAAWRARQARMRTFRFAWTERQTHSTGWIPNPRHPQREWLDIPGLVHDRSYVVSKTLAVDGERMRYSFELERREEPDGVRIVSRIPDLAPDGSRPANRGLGEARHYTYTSVFDGRAGRVRLTSIDPTMPPVDRRISASTDAQNLDVRPILMALRPLDPIMGQPLLDRAIPNRVRTLYEGRSTFLLEEQRDPSGWKSILRIDPERDFLVSRFGVYFEQKLMVDVAIDHTQDPRWGWIPKGWRISQRLADGSTHEIVVATVTSYSIDEPIPAGEFQ